MVALTKQQALDMLESDDLIGIGMEAHQFRLKKNDPRVATYQIDRNINYQFLHRVLFFLRVLPPARRERRLHSAVRGNLQENRRNAGTWRHRHFAPGWPAPGLANRLLRKSSALFKSALRASPSALFFRAGNFVHRGSQRNQYSRNDSTLDGCGSTIHSRWRRGNSRR